MIPQIPHASLSQSANLAVGYLSNVELRELDRMLPPQRLDVVTTLARRFEPYWQERPDSKREPELRRMVMAWFAELTGKSYAMLGDEERQLQPVRDGNNALRPVAEAVERWSKHGPEVPA